MGINTRKAETLGMPHGTANNRLRKNILFSLLLRYGENYCARCGATIDSVDELSIEHIEPWEGVSADLFWDLNNIAFSHLKCNRPHTNHGGASKRIVGAEGTSWCCTCQQFLSVDQFHKNSSRYDGLQKTCKACHSRYKK